MLQSTRPLCPWTLAPCFPWLCVPGATSPAASPGLRPPPKGPLQTLDMGHAQDLKSGNHAPGPWEGEKLPCAPGKGPPWPSWGSRGEVAEQGCELASAQERIILPPTALPPAAWTPMGLSLARAQFPHLPNVPNTQCRAGVEGRQAERRSTWALPSRCPSGRTVSHAPHFALCHVQLDTG